MTKYNIIYADPPWRYEKGWGNGRAPYETMPTADICALPVQSLLAEQAHLYLWVTNPFLADGLRVCAAWGFEYKTLITWQKLYPSGKPEMGMGYYFRGCTEHLIFGVRGGMKCLSKTERNFVAAVNSRRHSEKPAEFRRKIVQDWSGDLPRLEMFARHEAVGWDAWGNESPKGAVAIELK